MTVRLKVGDQVRVLSFDGNAPRAGGPNRDIAIGAVGVIVRDDYSSLPYRVEFSLENARDGWWFTDENLTTDVSPEPAVDYKARFEKVITGHTGGSNNGGDYAAGYYQAHRDIARTVFESNLTQTLTPYVAPPNITGIF